MMKNSKLWTLEEKTLYGLKTYGRANLGIRRQGRRDERMNPVGETDKKEAKDMEE